VDAARKFLLRSSTQHSCSDRNLPDAVLGVVSNPSSVGTAHHDSSIIGRLLQSFPPCHEEDEVLSYETPADGHDDDNHDEDDSTVKHSIDSTATATKTSAFRHEIKVKEIVDELHVVLIEPLLNSLFKAIKHYAIDEVPRSRLQHDDDEVMISLQTKKLLSSNAVVAALRTRDRWGRTPVITYTYIYRTVFLLFKIKIMDI
jgi:hypothetical protein